MNGVQWKTCEELNSTHIISGEIYDIPCSGHVIDIYQITKDGVHNDENYFADIIENNKELLFGASARILSIEMTLYFPRYNWWVYCTILYEYGIQGE